MSSKGFFKKDNELKTLNLQYLLCLMTSKLKGVVYSCRATQVSAWLPVQQKWSGGHDCLE